MKPILYPTDFSDTSKQALPFAIDLAKRTKSRLVIFHAYDMPMMVASNMFSGRARAMGNSGKRLQDESELKLKEFAQDVIGLRKIDHELIAVEGSPARSIRDYCDDNDAAFVVMGTIGATGLTRVLFGSVTSDVIGRVDCPVLAIPSNATPKAFENIVYATELGGGEQAAFEIITGFARLYNAAVTFLHVKQDDAEPEGHQELSEFLKNSKYDPVSRTEVMADDVILGIDDYTKDFPTDLLVMKTETRSFFDRLLSISLSRTEALHTDIPLLVLAG